MSVRPILAVIPARGGSKGLPGKNILSFVGMPLIAHSIRLAGLCPEIDRCVVSTDSEEIATVARKYGGDVPFLRPVDLAGDTTPAWPVLQHALHEIEAREGRRFGSLLLLQPTNPGRVPEDVSRATAMLESDPDAAGVIAVSEPHFNPRWTCVEERDGAMVQSFPDSAAYVRRQDVPVVYRMNGLLYLWRRDHVCTEREPKLYVKRHLLLKVPELRAIDIDSFSDLQIGELMIRAGLVKLPWL